MSKHEMLVRLKNIIEQNLEVEVSEPLKESDLLTDDLQIDSIMALQLIVYVEEEFNISIPEEGLGPEVFQTVGGIIALIEELQSSKEV